MSSLRKGFEVRARFNRSIGSRCENICTRDLSQYGHKQHRVKVAFVSGKGGPCKATTLISP